MRPIAILLLFTFAAAAQNVLHGKIIDEETKLPLESATVFISNTTYKTFTDNDGNFSIKTPVGAYQMVLSFVGYIPKMVTSDAFSDDSKRYVIALTTDTEKLRNVTVMSAKTREKYLQIFKDNLIGTSKNAEKTKFLNLDDVNLNLDDNGNLEVTSDNPLLIENQNLNYKITFVLAFLRYDFKNFISHYSGFQSFEELRPITEKNEQTAAKNRLTAYEGSVMHFARAVYNNTYNSVGFHVVTMSNMPNPLYPGEEGVKKLLAEARKNKSFAQWTAIPAKTITKMGDHHLREDEFVRTESDKKYFDFDEYLQVYYAGEKEEKNYIKQHERPFSGPQTSQVKISHKQVQLFPDGSFSNPENIIFHGYMGWEKLADALPYDYLPPEK